MRKELRNLAIIYNGKDYKQNKPGDIIPIYGTGGIMGYTGEYLQVGPAVLSGRKGTINSPIYVEGKFWNVDTVFCIKAVGKNDTKWLYYCFLNTNLTKLNEATGVPSVTSTALYRMKVDWVEPSVQRKIASILSTVDAQIEKTEAIIAKYQSIKQGMLHDLFTRGIDVATGKLRSTYEEAPELYKPSDIGTIPKDWHVEELGNCCNKKAEYGINAPAVDYSHSLPTYLRITDIGENGQFLSKDKRSVADVNAPSYFLELGDIVFARTGATVGKTYLYNPLDGVLVFAGFLIRFRPNSSILSTAFLKFFTEMEMYKTWVVIMSARSGQPGINGNEYASLKLPLPTVKEQELICARILSISELIYKENKFSQKLQSLKQGLMSDLLSGKVPVIVNESETV